LQPLKEKIKQRRAQMLVHSFLYYKMDSPVISDAQWQHWADELTGLQKEFSGKVDFYDRVFCDWDGSTGCHLPGDPWVETKARYVLSLCERG